MKVQIEFNTDNAAFDYWQNEIEHVMDKIKHNIFDKIEQTFIITNSKGNIIGRCRVEED